MQNIEKLASATYILKLAEETKEANFGEKLKSVLKAIGLFGSGGLAGGLIGEQQGYNRGYNTAASSSQQDLAKGLALMLQEIAQKGKKSA